MWKWSVSLSVNPSIRTSSCYIFSLIRALVWRLSRLKEIAKWLWYYVTLTLLVLYFGAVKHFTDIRNVMKLCISTIIYGYETSSFIAWSHLILAWLSNLQYILKSSFDISFKWFLLKLKKSSIYNRLIFHTKSTIFFIKPELLLNVYKYYIVSRRLK